MGDERKKVLTLVLLIIIVVAGYAEAYSEAASFKFEIITPEDGLSHPTVFCIMQDKKGFIWFGTQDGLNRYDGYNFKVFRNSPDKPYSISDNYITALYEDDSGSIWVGTYNGGLCRFDIATERFYRFQTQWEDTNSINSNRVTSIYEDKGGTLWISTDEGLCSYNRKTGKFTRYENLFSDNKDKYVKITRILEDKDGVLWIGTYGKGIGSFDKAAGSLTQLQFDADFPSNNWSSSCVVDFFIDSQGYFWIGTEDGLIKYNTKTAGMEHYKYSSKKTGTISGNHVGAILEDRRGNIWVGTNNGLDRFKRETGEFTSLREYKDGSNASSDYILDLFEDISGTIWLSTRNGIKRFVLPKFTLYKRNQEMPNTLSSNTISSIAKDKGGGLWIGTNNGLNRYDITSGTYKHYMYKASEPGSISSNKITGLLQDRQGILWVGTNFGLNKYDSNNESFSLYLHQRDDIKSISDNEISKIYEDSLGDLWIGTRNGGLNRFERSSGSFIKYENEEGNQNSIGSNNVSDIFEDREGILWVGTWGGGLYRFDRNTGKFQGCSKSMNHMYVLSVFEDSVRNLWVSFYNEGLKRYDRAEKEFDFNLSKDELANSNVYGIVEDNRGNLWLSTNTSLVKFEKSSNTIRAYKAQDGISCLPFNEGAYYKSEDDEIYFGGMNGLISFRSQVLNQTSEAPQLAVTDFKIFDRSALYEKELLKTNNIMLSYKENFISFEFALLDYSKTKNPEYYYKLDGFDSNWISCGSRRHATYTNLNGGKYTFRVKAKDDKGNWYEDGVEVGLTVSSPPWKTWWAYLAYVLILTLGTLGYIRYKTNLNVERLESQRLLEKLEYEKKQRLLSEAYENINRALTSTLDLEVVAEKLLENLHNIVSYDKGIVVLMENDNYRIIAEYGFDYPITGESVSAEDFEVFSVVQREQKPLIIPDIEKETRFTKHYSKTEIKSMMCIPLVSKNVVGGFLFLMSREKDYYKKEDADAIYNNIVQAGIAIENARLFKELAERTKMLADALESLEKTQGQLVESEKMVALGHLISGITHEINTPLGAIKSSIESVSITLDQTLEELTRFFKKISDEEEEFFFDLYKRSINREGNSINISTREERSHKKVLAGILAGQGVEDSESIADTLVVMGIYSDIEEYLPLFKSEKGLEVLRMTYNLSSLHRSTQTILLATERASKIVLAMKSYVHYDSTGQTVEMDIKEGIETILMLYYNRIKYSVEVVRDYKDIKPIMCYSDDLNQVWTNLIQNALQAMDYKGTLEIRTDEDNEYVIVSITDSGCGIPDSIKDKVFTPLFTTKPQGEGSGLGLNIAKKIVDKHKGKIEFESVPGKTTFLVYLPKNLCDV